jgi:hypothetical protein
MRYVAQLMVIVVAGWLALPAGAQEALKEPDNSDKPATTQTDPGNKANYRSAVKPLVEGPQKAEQAKRLKDLITTYRVHELKAKREKAAFLGVSGSPVPAVLREQLKLQHGIGVVVDHIEKDSPAGAAGLKPYDVLIKLNEQLLVDLHQLAVLVRLFKAGDEIKLTVIRQGQTITLTAKLAERESPALESSLLPWEMETPADKAVADGVSLLERSVNTSQPGWNYSVLQTVKDEHANADWNYSVLQSVKTGDTALMQLTPVSSKPEVTTWSDGQYTLTLGLSIDDAGRQHIALLALDKGTGNVLFKGAVDTPQQRDALPRVIAERLTTAALDAVKDQARVPATQPTRWLEVELKKP